MTSKNGLLLLSLLQGVACSTGMGGRPVSTDTTALPPCPSSPNCVSSQAEDESHRVEPLAFDGSPAEAMRRLRKVIELMPRARILPSNPGELRAEFSSRLFGFVDDLEARVDARRHVIEIRSASRTGYWDLGVNRGRVEEIRKAFEQRAPKSA